MKTQPCSDESHFTLRYPLIALVFFFSLVIMLSSCGSDNNEKEKTNDAKPTTSQSKLPSVTEDQAALLSAIPAVESQPAGFREAIRSNDPAAIDAAASCRGVVKEITTNPARAYGYASYEKDPSSPNVDDGLCTQYTTYSFESKSDAKKWFDALKAEVTANANTVLPDGEYTYKEAITSAGTVARAESAYGISTNYFYDGEATNTRFQVVGLKDRYIVIVDTDLTEDSAKAVSEVLLVIGSQK